MILGPAGGITIKILVFSLIVRKFAPKFEIVVYSRKNDISMCKSNYETPSTEVLVVRIERTILSGVKSSRTGYGAANQGVSEGELDTDGNWAWD